ncbi:MAG: DUF4105 domain-containing protein, partial [Bacteroides sp.]
TAIRYENLEKGVDVAFNYGMFSFNSPNFIFRFVKGETDYELGVVDFSYFEREYAMRNSSVYQQTLNLQPEEKEKLWQILTENYQPENRVYRYNFFFDNCTTRARDKIEECIYGTVNYQGNNIKKTFRDIIHEYTKGFPWSEFGIDICLGSEADKPIGFRQKMFSPFYLLHAMDSAKIKELSGKNRVMIKETQEIVTRSIEEKGEDNLFSSISPMVAMGLLLLFTLLFTVLGVWKGMSFWWLDILLFGIVGLAGCVIAFLVFFSVHPTVSPNYLLVLLNPIPLIYLPFMTYLAIKRRKDYYHLINFIVLTLFILLWGIIPQEISSAILPLTLCLLLRSASNLILTYKRK